MIVNVLMMTRMVYLQVIVQKKIVKIEGDIHRLVMSILNFPT
jgi:hypothetical protein